MLGDFETVLRLVGTLDDAPGEDNARQRFRGYLGTGLTELGSVRDAVQTCVTNSGLQYARALQDLVNHVGALIGFDVEYGRYQGVTGQVGHDGLWRSGDNVVVVEVKTTDAYTIRTDTLLNYINSLRSEGRIKQADNVIGLYVFARADPAVKQVEHAIIAEGRTRELRVASVDAILSLAELIRDETITSKEAIRILWPSGVWVDETVVLLGRVTSETGSVPGGRPQDEAANPPHAAQESGQDASECYLAPVADFEFETARETLERLLPARLWAMRQGTPHRAKVKPGDRIAFYQASKGVVATATVATAPVNQPRPQVKDPETYCWTFDLADVRMFLEEPVVIDAALRARLDAFQGRDPAKTWSWFVFAFRNVTEHDFRLLTGAAPS